MGGNLFTLPSVYRITTKVKQKSPLLTAQFSPLTKLICMFGAIFNGSHLWGASCGNHALLSALCVSYALIEMVNSHHVSFIMSSQPSAIFSLPDLRASLYFILSTSQSETHAQQFYCTIKTLYVRWKSQPLSLRITGLVFIFQSADIDVCLILITKFTDFISLFDRPWSSLIKN